MYKQCDDVLTVLEDPMVTITLGENPSEAALRETMLASLKLNAQINDGLDPEEEKEINELNFTWRDMCTKTRFVMQNKSENVPKEIQNYYSRIVKLTEEEAKNPLWGMIAGGFSVKDVPKKARFKNKPSKWLGR